MENEDPAFSNLRDQFGEHGSRVPLPCKDVATHDCIEWKTEAQLGWIPVDERNVVKGAVFGPLPGNFQRLVDSVCAYDLSSVTNKLSCHKGRITDAAPHVEDPHAGL